MGRLSASLAGGSSVGFLRGLKYVNLSKVATHDIENMRLIFGSLEYLVRVLSRCDIYERLYARKELQATKLLDTSLVNLYVSILRYLCCARKELSHRTLGRMSCFE
jgi:hypothetical protein